MKVAVIRIALADVEPPVMRTVEVPMDLALDRLHLVIQAAMGWQNCHMYDFAAGRSARWVTPDPDDDDGSVSPSSGTIADLFAAAEQCTAVYTYDFGDSWEHLLTLV